MQEPWRLLSLSVLPKHSTAHRRVLLNVPWTHSKQPARTAARAGDRRYQNPSMTVLATCLPSFPLWGKMRYAGGLSAVAVDGAAGGAGAIAAASAAVSCFTEEVPLTMSASKLSNCSAVTGCPAAI